MKNLKSLLLTTALTCGAGLLMGQQQSPPPANSPQNSQDVPHQTPGSNNPDMEQQRHPGTAPKGQTTKPKKKTKHKKQDSATSS